jgi:hypothetical protein
MEASPPPPSSEEETITTISTLISDGFSVINGEEFDKDITLDGETDKCSPTQDLSSSESTIDEGASKLGGFFQSTLAEEQEEQEPTRSTFLNTNNNTNNADVLYAPRTVFKQEVLTEPITAQCKTLSLCNDLSVHNPLPPVAHQDSIHQHDMGLHPASSSSLHHGPQSASSPNRTGSITRLCSRHPHIEVTLDSKELWDEFHKRGTEMIVNRAGRRMFPGFSVSISGLKPKAKYTMKLDIALNENHRFKFLNSRWLPVGSAEPQPQSEVYIHPDSPNTGSFWMRHGVSFRKLKITNNKDKPGNNALLHSMHKYYLRLLIEEERKTSSGELRQQSRPVLSIDFPETEFIAVTAYQNEEVTQLKISNNPFAKAFRETTADMDWDTAQALYGASPSYISPIGPMHHSAASNYVMSPSPSSWPLANPILSSPHPFQSSIHHLYHPMGTTHYTPDSPHFRHSLPQTPQGPFYQSPQPINRSHEMLSSYTAISPYVSSRPLTHPQMDQTSQIHQPGLAPLPDFDSTFIPVVVTSHS